MPVIFGIYLDLFSINRSSLSVRTNEGSALVEYTTEGSVQCFTEGPFTFGRSLLMGMLKWHERKQVGGNELNK